MEHNIARSMPRAPDNAAGARPRAARGEGAPARPRAVLHPAALRRASVPAALQCHRARGQGEDQQTG